MYMLHNIYSVHRERRERQQQAPPQPRNLRAMQTGMVSSVLSHKLKTVAIIYSCCLTLIFSRRRMKPWQWLLPLHSQIPLLRIPNPWHRGNRRRQMLLWPELFKRVSSKHETGHGSSKVYVPKVSLH